MCRAEPHRSYPEHVHVIMTSLYISLPSETLLPSSIDVSALFIFVRSCQRESTAQCGPFSIYFRFIFTPSVDEREEKNKTKKKSFALLSSSSSSCCPSNSFSSLLFIHYTQLTNSACLSVSPQERAEFVLYATRVSKNLVLLLRSSSSSFVSFFLLPSASNWIASSLIPPSPSAFFFYSILPFLPLFFAPNVFRHHSTLALVSCFLGPNSLRSHSSPLSLFLLPSNHSFVRSFTCLLVVLIISHLFFLRLPAGNRRMCRSTNRRPQGTGILPFSLYLCM